MKNFIAYILLSAIAASAAAQTTTYTEQGGAVTVTFTEPQMTLAVVIKVTALVFWGVLLFWTGAILSKGE